MIRFILCLSLVATVSSAQAADPVVNIKLTNSGDKAARVTITPAAGQTEFDAKSIAPTGATVRKTSRGEAYFYIDHDFQLKLTQGPLKVTASQGIESIPQTVTVSESTADGSSSIQLRRWIDMAQRHWYSGDSHIHINTGGPIRATIDDALLAGRAEGLNYLNLCVSNNLGDDLRDADKVTGRLEPQSTDRVLLSYGEEMRSSIYGHMQFFGIKKVVLPQYTGFDNTPNHLDYPSNYTLAREATDQGGVVTYGHPMLKNSPDAFSTQLTEANGAARELPIDVVLGTVHAMDLMSYNCDKQLSADLWYRLLNSGVKLSACVGTDALLDQSTDPAGGARVYAYVPDGLSLAGWLNALKAGQTFVTNGPMLELHVGDQGPGQTIKLDKPQSIGGHIQLDSLVAVDSIEVIVNGQVAKKIAVPKAPDAQVAMSVPFEIPLQSSSWIALRATGPDHPSLFDGPAWAHTSPVYVEINNQPIRIAEDRAFFVEWIEKLIRVVNTRNRYPSDQARQEVVDLFRKAQEFYR